MKTNVLTVTNSPMASAAGTNDIHGIKPPIAIPLSLVWVLIIIAVVIVVMAGIGVLVWWLMRKKAALPPPLPVVPPHVRARQKLQDALALMGQPRPFCIHVSDTIRLYLEERFTFHAPERTTEEFLYELQATDLLLPEQKQSLGEFLSVCDMVKFAKYEPGPPELKALHDSAVRLVDETEPQPVPVEPNAAETAQPA
jgi:hypothetical protein